MRISIAAAVVAAVLATLAATAGAGTLPLDSIFTLDFTQGT